MNAKPLTELAALTKDRLTVFVAGPGSGEGIAIALPNRGWVLVDGCKTREKYPLREIYRRYGRGPDDLIDCFVWTHPHMDHSGGVASLVAEEEPNRICLTGTSAKTTLAGLYEKLSKASRVVTSEHQKGGPVLQAVNAIMRHVADHPRSLFALRDGVELPLSTDEVNITTRAPDLSGLKEWLDQNTTFDNFIKNANDISAVLEVTFGKTRVVLGSDLPRLRSKGGPSVPTGWDSVIGRHGHLSDHAGLKLPHHGSAEAFHPNLHAAAVTPAWWVTPFNAAALPKIADLEGLPRLLKRRSSIELTALPASRAMQRKAPPNGLVRLKNIVPRGPPGGGMMLKVASVYVKPDHEPEPLEPVWCTEFDDKGHITGRYRGQVALEVRR